MSANRQGSGPHYAWLVAACGTLTLFSCLGLARFSLGVLLPPMAEALDMSYAQRGSLGTGYFFGYLAMVALAPLAVKKLGCRASIALGLGLIALTMCLLGAAGGLAPALVLYTVTGVGSGAANIPLMALISRWFGPSLRGVAVGLVVAGNGLGIIFSGFAVPAVAAAGPMGWRWAWALLGAISAAVAVVSWFVLRDTPADKGLEPLGGDGPGHVYPYSDPLSPAERRALVHLGVLYFLFGATYMVYGTFVVTTMIEDHGLAAGLAGRFWSWVGLFGMFSGPLFGKFSDLTSRRLGLAGAFAFQTTAYLLAGLAGSAAPLYVSVVFYGLAAFSVPTVMAAAVADRLGPARTAKGFSLVTLSFAVGQVVGPYGAGLLADLSGGFSSAYLASASLTGLAAALSLMLPSRLHPLTAAEQS